VEEPPERDPADETEDPAPTEIEQHRINDERF
jgi:hypothetical protein